MLIGNTMPWTVFVHEGYVRRSLRPYSGRISIGDPPIHNVPKPLRLSIEEARAIGEVTGVPLTGTPDGEGYLVETDEAVWISEHVTNTKVQMTHFNYTYNRDDHIWSTAQLRSYLDLRQPYGTTGAWVDGTLIPMALRTARMLFEAARPELHRRAGAFQLLGLDFIVDANMKIYFLEANGNPGMGLQSAWKIAFGESITRSMLRLIERIQLAPPYTRFDTSAGLTAPSAESGADDAGFGWRLAYSEQSERCEPTPQPYNVCDAFGYFSPKRRTRVSRTRPAERRTVKAATPARKSRQRD